MTGANASPYNRARLDGRPTEYSSDELRATWVGASAWGDDGTITNLFITWNHQYLYVALHGWERGNKLVVLLDVDPTNGTGATTLTNWTAQGADYVRYNDYGWAAAGTAGAPAFGLDYMIASEGYFHDILRITYNGAAFDTGAVEQVLGVSGAIPHGTASDIVALEDSSPCLLKGVEARIPWSVIYEGGRFGVVATNEVVPRGAVLRVFAGLHNNDPNISWSSPDTLPPQSGPNSFYTNGLLISDTYIDVAVDQDLDGLPDGAESDVNGPYLVMLQGQAANTELLAVFNESVTTDSVKTVAHWSVNGIAPLAVDRISSNQARVRLGVPLPDATNWVSVVVTAIVDSAGNTNDSRLCFTPATGGLSSGMVVRFLLETASGLGLNPGASNYFINGSVVPLEWGYPPETTAPLQNWGETWYYRDVYFPPGTPTTLYYKYSGQLSSDSGRGTNNYEAIRLHRYADASRVLTLPTNVGFMVVTDYLGVAAHPWRDSHAASNAGYNAVYYDAQRGDAGVRQRTTVLFQLDLSKRNRAGITRVLLLGSDPLRGFNLNNERPPVSDYPTAGAMSWNTAGLTLFDDGTHGDLVSGDGVYSREWIFSTNGFDDMAEPDWPHSLVGGGEFDPPYYGTDYWAARRSPRSFAYKFAVYKSGTGEALESPSYDLEYYIQDGGATGLVLTPFTWDNENLPAPPPSNAPTLMGVAVSGKVAVAIISNEPSEWLHGLQIATNLITGWMDYGHRAVSNAFGLWEVYVANASGMEMYRAFAGPATPYRGVRWFPNPLSETGGVLHIEFCQHRRALAGYRNVQIAGSFNGWSPEPMTFVGDGTWVYDAVISADDPTNIEFKVRDLSGAVWCGMGGDEGWRPNYVAYKGILRATWFPEVVTNGAPMTIMYDASGGNLATSGIVYAHVGYDENWGSTADLPMTNIGGSVWTISFTVSSNYNTSVNMVFTDGSRWDSEYSGGRVWRAFIARP